MEGRKFKKVVLMGPYWSGTNAVREEVAWRFKVAVLNPDKLDVSAVTNQSVEALRECLGDGTITTKTTTVGGKIVPRGFKLLKGSSGKRAWPRVQSKEIEKPHQALQLPLREEVEDNLEDEDQIQESKKGEEDKENEVSTAEQGSADQRAKPRRSWEPPLKVQIGPSTDGDCLWWKHTVRQPEHGAMDTDDSTLVILVTKDPSFWLKSMSKHLYEIKVESGKKKGYEALFCAMCHEGRRYDDAVELWKATMDSYLDEARYPSNRCVLLRYEDFLFRFWEIMVHLAAFLPADIARLKEPPLVDKSKGHGQQVRGRSQALKHYSLSKNRITDFATEHLEKLRVGLGPALLELLGYESVDATAGGPPRLLCPWVPQLIPNDILVAAIGEDLGGDGELSWVRVLTASEGDQIQVERLTTVPKAWLVPGSQDWTIVDCENFGQNSMLNPDQEKFTLPQDSLLDLRLPAPRGSLDGKVAPLSEEGYRAVVLLRSTHEMADFVTRVIESMDVDGAKGKVVDRRKLLGFARWFSGEALIQSLAQIREELPSKVKEKWVKFSSPVRSELAADQLPPPPRRPIPVTS